MVWILLLAIACFGFCTCQTYIGSAFVASSTGSIAPTGVPINPAINMFANVSTYYPTGDMTPIQVREDLGKKLQQQANDPTSWTFILSKDCQINLKSSSPFNSAGDFLVSSDFVTALSNAIGSPSFSASKGSICQHLAEYGNDLKPEMYKKDRYYKTYVLQALLHWSNAGGLPQPKQSDFGELPPACEMSHSVCASITPFKKGELDSLCQPAALKKYLDVSFFAV